MSVKYKASFCEHCQTKVRSEAHSNINHVLHAVLTLLTCAWWAIPWLLMMIFDVQDFACPKCGTVTERCRLVRKGFIVAGVVTLILWFSVVFSTCAHKTPASPASIPTITTSS
jgi:hypothetical protein